MSITIKNILKRLFGFAYGVSYDNQECIDSYQTLLPFSVHKFDSGLSLRGWTIPNAWIPLQAILSFQDGSTYDCLKDSQLGLAYLSESFLGLVSSEDLVSRTCFREDLPSAVVYDWTRLYKPLKGGWCLCIPKKDLDLFPSGDVDVCIDTRSYPDKMVVYDYFLPGQSDKEVVFNAHNCHPFQANDDLSGCAVLIAFFQYLSTLPTRRYSYRLLIAPELFGPMFWLDRFSESAENIKACILVKSVGNVNSLQCQNSFYGNSYLDNVVAIASRSCNNIISTYHPYRTYHGNDETIFEAPGYNIPTVSLSRVPFLEYHTNLDTPDRISEDRLKSTLDLLKKIHYVLETDFDCTSVSPGLYCLSSPLYSLYRSSEEQGISDVGTSLIDKSWNLLMNCLPRELQDGLKVSELSLKYQLPYDELLNYITKWSDVSLCERSATELF